MPLVKEYDDELKELEEPEEKTDLMPDVVAGLNKIAETGAKHVYYDKKLGESISSAIVEAARTITKSQGHIDLSPLVAEIGKYNKTLVDAIAKLKQPDNSKFESLLETTLEAIKKSNELIASIPKPVDHTDQLERLIEAISRPKRFEHQVVRGDFVPEIKKVISQQS